MSGRLLGSISGDDGENTAPVIEFAEFMDCVEDFLLKPG